MSPPLSVAVIVPTFNRAELLRESLASILTQSRPAREVIVVDDGSSDHTAEVVRRFSGAVDYLSQINSGKAAAINAGIQRSQSDAVLVLDDDDLLPAGALLDHSDALDRSPACGFSYGRYVRFRSGDPDPFGGADIEPVNLDDPRRLFIRLIEHDFLPNPSWMVRRSLANEVGDYAKALKRSQDFEMILRLSRVSQGVFTDSVVLAQREHAAERGQGAERHKTTHTIDLWVKYDALMMAGVDALCSDHDFRPFEVQVSPSTCILQRAVSNFTRNNFDGALSHLARYKAVAGAQQIQPLDEAIATRMLSASHGLDAAMDPEIDLASRLHGLGLSEPLRRRLAAQSAWRLKDAVRRRDFRQARNLWRFTRAAFGISPLQAARYRSGPFRISDYPSPRV